MPPEIHAAQHERAGRGLWLGPATGSTAGLPGREQPAAPAILHGLARGTAPTSSRHMTKGQRVMVVAKIYPEPEKGKRTDLLKNSTGLGFDKAYLSHARTVLEYAPAGSSQRWDSATVFDS